MLPRPLLFAPLLHVPSLLHRLVLGQLFVHVPIGHLHFYPEYLLQEQVDVARRRVAQPPLRANVLFEELHFLLEDLPQVFLRGELEGASELDGEVVPGGDDVVSPFLFGVGGGADVDVCFLEEEAAGDFLLPVQVLEEGVDSGQVGVVDRLFALAVEVVEGGEKDVHFGVVGEEDGGELGLAGDEEGFCWVFGVEERRRVLF